jgi:mono/diheme cytochrome c family protein
VTNTAQRAIERFILELLTLGPTMTYIHGAMQNLFDTDGETEALAPGAVLQRGRALAVAAPLVATLERIAAEAPFRRMTTCAACHGRRCRMCSQPWRTTPPARRASRISSPTPA